MARGMSEAERYQRQYKFLHKIQRDLSEAGVTCHYRNRALTNGTPNSPFSVFFTFGSMSNGETVMELNIHIDGKTYNTLGEDGRTQMGLAQIKARYGATPQQPKDLTSSIVAYENDELDAEDEVALMQSLIDSGMAWKLQGSYGRAAMAMIESGQCMLGETGHRDYWGNYVPSRYEVQPGTKGSREYVEAHEE